MAFRQTFLHLETMFDVDIRSYTYLHLHKKSEWVFTVSFLLLSEQSNCQLICTNETWFYTREGQMNVHFLTWKCPILRQGII
jgi:hypothetical protein